MHGPDQDYLPFTCLPQPVLYFIVLKVKWQEMWWPDPCMVESRLEWVTKEMKWEKPIFHSFGQIL